MNVGPLRLFLEPPTLERTERHQGGIKRKNLFLIAVALTLLPLTVGCGSSSPEAADESPVYWPTDGWKTSTPEQQGMDSDMLAEAVRLLAEQDDYEVHSLLIIRNGYIVTDACFHPFAKG